jgi:hypothetical protein
MHGVVIVQAPLQWSYIIQSQEQGSQGQSCDKDSLNTCAQTHGETFMLLPDHL